MYTDRRIGQYTVVTPRAAIVWSVAIHLAAFIGSACAWEDGAVRPERVHKMTAGPVPAAPFLFWPTDGQRGEEPVALKAVVDAITRFVPVAERVRASHPLVRRYRYPIWVAEELVQS